MSPDLRRDPQLAQEALLEAIAARLDDLMAQQAITQAQLFLRAKGAVGENTVGNVLRAHDHRVSTLIKIAHALDCTVEIRIQPNHNIVPQSNVVATYIK